MICSTEGRQRDEGERQPDGAGPELGTDVFVTRQQAADQVNTCSASFCFCPLPLPTVITEDNQIIAGAGSQEDLN